MKIAGYVFVVVLLSRGCATQHQYIVERVKDVNGNDAFLRIDLTEGEECAILFAVMSLTGLWLALRARQGEIHPGVRIHSLLVSAACCVVTLFLISWHLIGLRLWAA
jgi:hypothetical protein